MKPNIPESFRVLVKELQSLMLEVDLLGANGIIADNSEVDAPEDTMPSAVAEQISFDDLDAPKKRKDYKKDKKK